MKPPRAHQARGVPKRGSRESGRIGRNRVRRALRTARRASGFHADCKAIPPRPDRRVRCETQALAGPDPAFCKGMRTRRCRRAIAWFATARLSPGDRLSLAGAGAGSSGGWNEEPAMDLRPIGGRPASLVLPQAARSGTAIRGLGHELAAPGWASRQTKSLDHRVSDPLSRRREIAGGKAPFADALSRQGIGRDRHGARLVLRRPERADAALPGRLRRR